MAIKCPGAPENEDKLLFTVIHRHPFHTLLIVLHTITGFIVYPKMADGKPWGKPRKSPLMICAASLNIVICTQAERAREERAFFTFMS